VETRRKEKIFKNIIFYPVKPNTGTGGKKRKKQQQKTLKYNILSCEA
jgi:hypothetical protein